MVTKNARIRLVSSTLCFVVGISLIVGATPQGSVPQQCGKVRTIWTNSKPDPMTVVLTLTDKCHEPEDKGTVTVYDQSGTAVQTGSFSKDLSPVTLSRDVPPHGRIDFICSPSAIAGEQNCESTISSVTPMKTLKK
jgi:hypothetical protein